MNKKLSITIASATAITFLLAACGSETPASTASLPDENQQVAQQQEQPSVNWASVEAFVNADPKTGYAGLVAPGSPAERWTEFAIDLHNAEVANGVSRSDDGEKVEIDKDTGIVTVSIEATYDDELHVYKMTDWVTDAEGRVVSYSDENGIPIADRIWTKEPSGTSLGETVTVLSAFRTSYGYMAINVAIQTDNEFIDWDAAYLSPDGIARKPADSVMNEEAIAGATSLATYYYEAAAFGGTFVYKTYDEWNSTNISLVIQ